MFALHGVISSLVAETSCDHPKMTKDSGGMAFVPLDFRSVGIWSRVHIGYICPDVTHKKNSLD